MYPLPSKCQEKHLNGTIYARHLFKSPSATLEFKQLAWTTCLALHSNLPRPFNPTASYDASGSLDSKFEASERCLGGHRGGGDNTGAKADCAGARVGSFVTPGGGSARGTLAAICAGNSRSSPAGSWVSTPQPATGSMLRFMDHVSAGQASKIAAYFFSFLVANRVTLLVLECATLTAMLRALRPYVERKNLPIRKKRVTSSSVAYSMGTTR